MGSGMMNVVKNISSLSTSMINRQANNIPTFATFVDMQNYLTGLIETYLWSNY